jgi:hypothetical protein
MFLNQFLKILRKQFKEGVAQGVRLHHCSILTFQIRHDLLKLLYLLQLLQLLQLFFG